MLGRVEMRLGQVQVHVGPESVVREAASGMMLACAAMLELVEVEGAWLTLSEGCPLPERMTQLASILEAYLRLPQHPRLRRKRAQLRWPCWQMPWASSLPLEYLQSHSEHQVRSPSCPWGLLRSPPWCLVRHLQYSARAIVASTSASCRDGDMPEKPVRQSEERQSRSPFHARRNLIIALSFET